MTRWFLVAAVATGCTEADPVTEAWNRVFEVDRLVRDPGCGIPTTEAAPPQSYVATGYFADPVFELDSLSVFWCEEPGRCFQQPQANALLEVIEVDRVSGSFGEAEFVAASLCSAYFNAIDATQTPEGAVTIDIVLSTPEPAVVSSEEECLALLDDVAAVQCDERLIIEARRVDD